MITKIQMLELVLSLSQENANSLRLKIARYVAVAQATRARNRQLKSELLRHQVNAQRLAKELRAVLASSRINFESILEALAAHDELFK